MKPLLAGKVDSVDKLRYPLVASPKIDGIRCLIVDGVAMSRKLLPIPNEHIRRKLGKHRSIIEGFDGELCIPGKSFNEVSSAIMSEDGQPVFTYVVFDIWTEVLPYARRLTILNNLSNEGKLPPGVQVVHSKVVENAKELLGYEEYCLSWGYEGVMVRSLTGQYKQGRSTTNEGILLKLKRFEDAEAVIIGAEEERQNGNAATMDALGHTKRSSHNANKHGKGTLGAFVCSGKEWTETFKVGTGFTAEQRDLYWRGFDMLKGRTIKYRYQPSGAKDKPRFPSFIGFRDERDM